MIDGDKLHNLTIGLQTYAHNEFWWKLIIDILNVMIMIEVL